MVGIGLQLVFQDSLRCLEDGPCREQTHANELTAATSALDFAGRARTKCYLGY